MTGSNSDTSQTASLTVKHFITPDQPLRYGERLVSDDGQYFLELSCATGLIVKNNAGTALWALGITPSWIVDHLAMQSDKNLVLYTAPKDGPCGRPTPIPPTSKAKRRRF